MKLGIFDSGIGGEAVAQALQKTFPEAIILTVNDRAHLPYGDKTSQQVISFTDAAIQPLLKSSCDIIILACNTATTLAIKTLRDRYPKMKFIGIEPMVKSAAKATSTDVIAVCATPATLASSRYHNLTASYAQGLTIIEPDCSKWAYMIENNEINHQQIKATVTMLCDKGADVIVLGCTHYHWIKDFVIHCAAGRAAVLEPSEAIGRQVEALLGLS